MTSLIAPIVRPWSIRIPNGFRYLESHYIQKFFESGELQLTTYSSCKKHESEIRKDELEGKCHFELSHGNEGVAGHYLVGYRSYMLCLSMIESKSLMERFSVDGYFLINDLQAFAEAIAKCVPNFESGKIGACTYLEARSIKKSTSLPLNLSNPQAMINALEEANTLKSEAPVDAELKRMQNTISRAIDSEMGDDPYFIKENKFSVEAELRIVWTVPYNVEAPLLVACPEAVRFCSQVTTNS